MVITAANYNSTPVYDLLVEASQGRVGIDQRLLRSITSRGEAAVDDIVRFGLGNRGADRIQLDEDLIALIQYIGSPKALPYLIEYLRHEPLDPTEDLVHAFQRIGSPAVEPLLELYNELGPEDGGDVAFILATLRNRDPRILQLIASRIPQDAGDAAFLFSVFGDPAAKPILQELIERAGSDPALARSLGKEAEEALASLDQEVVEDAAEPVNIFEVYPEYIEPVFDVLPVSEKIEFLQCGSAELRADCATSFIDRELPEEVVPLMIAIAKSDPNVGVRSVACAALSSLADNEEVFQLLRSKVADTSVLLPERCGALIGISSRLKEQPELKPYVDEFYANPATRARAVEAMWRSMDPSYAEIYRSHLNDEDIDVRRQAIKGIGFAEVSSEANKLVELFMDEEFRLDALFSYALCVPVKKLERGNMPALLRRIEELAGALSEHEGEVVETALDTRLMLHGLEPVFLPIDEEED
jgi:HEAT repeat protein